MTSIVEESEKSGKGNSALTTAPLLPPKRHSTKPLSMRFMRSLCGLYCRECGFDPSVLVDVTKHEKDDGMDNKDIPSDLYNLQTFERSASSISPLVAAPMLTPANLETNTVPVATTTTTTIEALIGEYICHCQFFKVPYNAGIITTLRFSLPSLRVTGSFHDLDMLALVELLMRHANGKLNFIRRLDFGIASREGRQFKGIKMGFSSHGALALAKALQKTRYIQQVWLPRHRIGPFGASALFLACRDNPSIQMLNLQKCRIRERGAFAFCELLTSPTCGLVDVDLSSNGIGHRGTTAIERAVQTRNQALSSSSSVPPIFVNLDANLVFPEIMNGVTHGLGVVLSIIGGYLLSHRVGGQSFTHVLSCAVYTTSLIVLYLCSTLFHSFFALQNIKYLFQVMDKCAIYVLIAGSYTPFLTVMFEDDTLISIGLLSFIWTCGFWGIVVEAFYPTWKYKSVFSLSMYLGMGWAALVCLPKLSGRVPLPCAYLLLLGGVGYTAGVPFYVRNNNLDHAIWHLFVLLGSICHWLAVYLYVAPYSPL